MSYRNRYLKNVNNGNGGGYQAYRNQGHRPNGPPPPHNYNRGRPAYNQGNNMNGPPQMQQRNGAPPSSHLHYPQQKGAQMNAGANSSGYDPNKSYGGNDNRGGGYRGSPPQQQQQQPQQPQHPNRNYGMNGNMNNNNNNN
eukprot:286357_1